MAPKCWWYLWSKRPWLFLSPLQKSCWAANAPGNSGCRWSFAETPDLSGWSRSAFCQGGRKASGENTIFWQKAIILRSKMSHFGSLKNCAVTCVRGMSKVKSSCQTDINFEIKLFWIVLATFSNIEPPRLFHVIPLYWIPWVFAIRPQSGYFKVFRRCLSRWLATNMWRIAWLMT